MKTEANASKLAYCHAKLPNAGLGNKLFIWAKAMVFAKLNNLPLVVSGWTQFQLAPILHGGDFRFYWNYFRPVCEVGFFDRQRIQRKAQIILDPPLVQTSLPDRQVIYEFTQIPHWGNFFGDLKPHRDGVCEAMLGMLSQSCRREYDKARKPVVSLQVRMGDFLRLRPGEDFAKVGGVRTPLDYFINVINFIREIHEGVVPVTIFSDAPARQLRELLILPNVQLAPHRRAVVDMLLMSASKVLVTSAGSTFGYWAGFLGESAIIMHPDHIHQPIRPLLVNKTFYEGAAPASVQMCPQLLKQNIVAIGGDVSITH